MKNSASPFTEQIDFGLPGVRRTKNVQCYKCCQQLDDRRRIAGHVLVPGQHRLTGVQILDIDAKAVIRRFAQVQGIFYAGRQYTFAKPEDRQNGNYQGQKSDLNAHVQMLICDVICEGRAF